MTVFAFRWLAVGEQDGRGQALFRHDREHRGVARGHPDVAMHASPSPSNSENRIVPSPYSLSPPVIAVTMAGGTTRPPYSW